MCQEPGLKEVEVIAVAHKLKTNAEQLLYLSDYISKVRRIMECISEFLDVGNPKLLFDRSYSSYEYFHKTLKITPASARDIEKIKELLVCKRKEMKRFVKKLSCEKKRIKLIEKYKHQIESCDQDMRITFFGKESLLITIFKELEKIKHLPEIESNILIAGHFKCSDTKLPYNADYRLHRHHWSEKDNKFVYLMLLFYRSGLICENERTKYNEILNHFENSEGKAFKGLRQKFNKIKEAGKQYKEIKEALRMVLDEDKLQKKN